ncbi:hypothetical protein CBL_07260 [Carabus blaptoides fortunei]
MGTNDTPEQDKNGGRFQKNSNNNDTAMKNNRKKNDNLSINIVRNCLYSARSRMRGRHDTIEPRVESSRTERADELHVKGTFLCQSHVSSSEFGEICLKATFTMDETDR